MTVYCSHYSMFLSFLAQYTAAPTQGCKAVVAASRDVTLNRE